MLVETDVDHRQARQCRPHDIELAGNGQLHLVEAHATHPREVRVGQQQTAAIGRTPSPDGHRIATALRGKTLLPGQRRGKPCRRRLAGLGWWLRPGQRFDELPDTAFGEQPTGQLDQVLAADRPQPLAVATFGGQPLAAALGQRPVVAAGITCQQRLHRRWLRLQERIDCRWCVEPGEEHIAGQVVTLLQGLALGTEVARALATHGQHFIGQQAQVVLGIGVADAIAQAALVLGNDVRHPVSGSANLRTGIGCGGLHRRCADAEGCQGGSQACASHGMGKWKHGQSSGSGVIPIRRMAR